MLKCRICGFENDKSILSHVRTVHKISGKEYKAQFSDSPLRISWMANDLNAMDAFRKVGKKNSELIKGRRSHASLPDGKWSRKYDKCVRCGRTNYPHSAKGKCGNCYRNDQIKERTSKKNEVLCNTGTENIDYVICKICNMPFESLTTNGHLREHGITVKQYKRRFSGAATRCERNLERLGMAISEGRKKLFQSRGYLNPLSQRMSKSTEMSRRHSQGDFNKISLAESKIAKWFMGKGYNIRIGEASTGNDNVINWQANVLPGCCVDFASDEKLVVVEVLGRWWHGFDYLQGKQDFESLHPAVKRNIVLDKKRFEILKENNWKVIKIWDHQITEELESIFPMIGSPVTQDPQELIVLSKVNAPLSADMVLLKLVARTYREDLNARWLGTSGFVKIIKSKVDRNDIDKLRKRLDELGEKSAVPRQLLETEFKKVRSRGFPYHSLSDYEQRLEWKQLSNTKMNKNTKGAFKWAGHGTRLANLFHPHMFECRKKGKLSPKEFFESDEDLKRGLDKMLCRKGRLLTESDVRSICKTESSTGWVNNFPPRVAISIVKSIFNPTSSVKVLDPCAGFSGRLIGCAAARVGSYCGIDLSGNTVEGLQDTKQFLEKVDSSTKVEIVQGDCLEIMPSLNKDFDLILASTPFWDAEEYKGIESYPSYRGWLNNFLKPFFESCSKLLRQDGFMAFYVDHLKDRNFAGDLMDIANEHFVLKNEVLFIKTYDELNRSTKVQRYVKIPVWQLR